MSDKSKTDNTKDLIDQLYQKLDHRIKDLSETVKNNILPEAESKLKKNVFTSLLLSFAMGFLLGIIVAVSNSKKKKK